MRLLANLSESLQDLQDVRTQRLEKLREKDPDTYKAVQWLESNRSRFRGSVYDPILLEMNLKDPRYASAIETILGGVQGPHLKVILVVSSHIIAFAYNTSS